MHLGIFHSSKHCLASDRQKQKRRLVNNTGADCLLQRGSVTVQGGTMWGPDDRGVCETLFCFFSCLIILLFLCHHPPASLAPGPPAELVAAPSPSPAARHSRSQVRRRGWTEGNLKNKPETRKWRRRRNKNRKACECSCLCLFSSCLWQRGWNPFRLFCLQCLAVLSSLWVELGNKLYY